MMRASPEEAQEMADAISAFKKALREAVAKDLRRVAAHLLRIANLLAPPKIRHWEPIDFSKMRVQPEPEASKSSWRVPGLRLRECGQIIYGREHSWGVQATKGGTCHLPRGHDGDCVPT